MGGGFTLVELLVVIAILVLLISILTPSMNRAIFTTRSTHCGASQRQIAEGMTNYASENEGYYPSRWAGVQTYNHPYWFGRPNHVRDLHEEFEKYLGPAEDGGPPQVLLCSVNPEGIWGIKIRWPLSGIYRTNVAVYAGYDWSSATASCCVPHHPLDEMPQRTYSAKPWRPLSGDLTEYMTGNSTSGYGGWDTSHSSDPRYHVRGKNPEEPPPDPIPFSYGDGSVRFAREFEACYTDPGWGTNYWPVP